MLGLSVVGTAVLSVFVGGTAVLGLSVVGTAVLGLFVVGKAVLGLSVVGTAVLEEVKKKKKKQMSQDIAESRKKANNARLKRTDTHSGSWFNERMEQLYRRYE